MEEAIKNNYDLELLSINKNEDSTDGNVYNVKTSNNKYIIKIYDNLESATNMINLHNSLKDLYIPRIISTKDNSYLVEYNNKYIVMYSFLEGIQISKYIKENDNTYNEEVVRQIAKSLRKLHDLTENNNFNLKTIDFANNLSRKSVLHFDLTKENIFINNNEIGFIDFDDFKYGDSICDVAILIAFLFISKKRGIDNKSINIFLDNYYKVGEKELKENELRYIKPYIKEWIDYLLSGHEFDSSLKDSFEFKKVNSDNIEIG